MTILSAATHWNAKHMASHPATLYRHRLSLSLIVLKAKPDATTT